MNNTILKLKTVSKNCYGTLNVNSSAMIIDELDREYLGVTVNTKVYCMSCISNVICNAVSEGSKKFKKIYVYIDSYKETEISALLDEEALRLLKEFKLNYIYLILADESINEINLTIY